jgi:SAM-dependent methyltransferase
MQNIKTSIYRHLPAFIRSYVFYFQYSRFSKIPNYEFFVDATHGKKGIEIGGPSLIFQRVLPIYSNLKSLDGVNFSSNTLWESSINELNSQSEYKIHGKSFGTQYIMDATDLTGIGDDKYGCLLSSNCLEHIANPVKALLEWRRVLVKGGHLVLVLPNKKCNFDNMRNVVDFSHLVDDFENNISENDFTHLKKYLVNMTSLWIQRQGIFIISKNVV